MKRIWIVDDNIPLHRIVPGPQPTAIEAHLARHLLSEVGAAEWPEPEVHALCTAVLSAEFEPTFFLSPSAMSRALSAGAVPPHAVVFDWEYLGAKPEDNLPTLERLLAESFAYVQIYTHLPAQSIEPLLDPLRIKHGKRLLQVRTKSSVQPAQLAAEITSSWQGTMAGELADQVRSRVRLAVEHALIDMCAVPRIDLASMADGKPDNLVQIVLSRVRDELGVDSDHLLEELGKEIEGGASAPGEDLRRLLSVWYYYFPADDRVRRGDIVEVNGALGIIVTPTCDLADFPKKSGRRLTWVKCVALAEELASVNASGLKLTGAGRSITAKHGDTEAVVILPSVPQAAHQRESLADYAILCHAWENKQFLEPSPEPVKTGEKKGKEKARYKNLTGVVRRCTLAEPFASSVVAKIASVMASHGVPDMPTGEHARLQKVVSPEKPAAKTKG